MQQLSRDLNLWLKPKTQCPATVQSLVGVVYGAACAAILSTSSKVRHTMPEIQVTIKLKIGKRLHDKLQSMDMLHALENNDLDYLPSLCMRDMLEDWIHRAYEDRLKSYRTHSNYTTDKLIKELLAEQEYEMQLCSRN